MKKEILSLGKALTKQQQQVITGGFGDPCFSTPVSACFHSNGCQVFSCPDGTDYCGPARFHISPC